MNTVKRDSFPYDEVEKRIGYCFKNKDLLLQAFTRRSYERGANNEVIEFIGDSIIGMLVTKILTKRYQIATKSEEYVKALSDHLGYDYSEPGHFICVLDEDELSKLKIELVQRSSLALATESLGLEQYLLMGKSDIKGEVQKQKSVKEDLFEAIIGAIAVDTDWDMPLLEDMVDRLINIDHRLENGMPGEPDCVEILEKWFAEKGKNLEFEIGPSHCAELPYECFVDLDMGLMSDAEFGYGKTEKEAQRMAAKQAVEYIRVTTDRIAAISAAVGKPNEYDAVRQLQELYQKKMIPEPKYDFYEDSSELINGNPTWTCICTIAGLEGPNYYDNCDSKKEAKRSAAYEALMRLCDTGIKQNKD